MRFIVIVGGVSALVGGLLLVMLPRYGYSMAECRTLLFIYASISQLLLAYPARRIIVIPRLNISLHFAVIFCIGLQLLTIFVPGLRLVLGLEQPGLLGLIWVGAAVVLSSSLAEIYARLSGCRPSKNDRRANSMLATS